MLSGLYGGEFQRCFAAAPPPCRHPVLLSAYISKKLVGGKYPISTNLGHF